MDLLKRRFLDVEVTVRMRLATLSVVGILRAVDDGPAPAIEVEFTTDSGQFVRVINWALVESVTAVIA